MRDGQVEHDWFRLEDKYKPSMRWSAPLIHVEVINVRAMNQTDVTRVKGQSMY